MEKQGESLLRALEAWSLQADQQLHKPGTKKRIWVWQQDAREDKMPCQLQQRNHNNPCLSLSLYIHIIYSLFIGIPLTVTEAQSGPALKW